MDAKLAYALFTLFSLVLICLVIILVEYIIQNKKATAHLEDAYRSLITANNEMTAICEKLGAIRWSMKYVVGGEIIEVVVHAMVDTPKGPQLSIRKMKDLSAFYLGLSDDERKRIEDAVSAVINDPTGKIGLDLEYSHEDANHPLTWYRALGGSTLSSDGKTGEFFGVFMNINDRIERQRVEHEAATIDYLTKLYNRSSYELELARLSQNPGELGQTYIGEIDINGIRNVNDNIGHVAGDELICATADILQEVFGYYGKCFRIGGDEFVVLFQADERSYKTLVDRMRSLAFSWKGNQAEKLSFSFGFVKGSEFEEKTIDELIKIADDRMNESKNAYRAIAQN